MSKQRMSSFEAFRKSRSKFSMLHISMSVKEIGFSQEIYGEANPPDELKNFEFKRKFQ